MVHQGGPRNPYHPGRRAPGRPVHPGPSRIILLPSECGPDLDAVASQTPHYVQVVGFIDQVKIDMLPDDYGGEMVRSNLLLSCYDCETPLLTTPFAKQDPHGMLLFRVRLESRSC